MDLHCPSCKNDLRWKRLRYIDGIAPMCPICKVMLRKNDIPKNGHGDLLIFIAYVILSISNFVPSKYSQIISYTVFGVWAVLELRFRLIKLRNMQRYSVN
jgi:hypothetical protein